MQHISDSEHAGDGVDLPSGRHLHPGPDHLRHRRQEGIRGHGSLLIRWKQHLRRHSRVRRDAFAIIFDLLVWSGG